MAARKGEDHHRAKLSEIDVRLIHYDRNPVRDIARRFGVSAGMVSQIKSGKRWSWLPRIRHRERPAPPTQDA